MIYVQPGETLNRIVTDAPTGLVGQVGVRVETDDDTIAIPRTTDGIVEFAAGAYRAAIDWPEEPGTYVDIWDFPGGAEVVGDEEIRVSASGPPAGDPYFTTGEAQAYLDDDSYDEGAIDDARLIVESKFESECGVSFVPREAAEILDGSGSDRLALRWAKVRAVTAATNDGAELDVSAVRPTRLGAYRTGGWPAGVSNLEVTYEHGYDQPPPVVKRAALRYLREVLIAGPIDDRAIRVDLEDGSYQRAIASPRKPTGIPDVDVVLASHDFRALVA